MNFDDILLGIVIGIGMVLLYAWYQYQCLKQHIEHLLEQSSNETAAIGLEIEVDKGQYFCYNAKNKQFICQGKTVAEIQHAFQTRYPDSTAYLAAGDPAIIQQFKSELETHENSPRV